MTYDEAMARLEALGSEKMRAMNARHGAGHNQFGVKMGDIRVLAKEIKVDPELAKRLWDSGSIDAQFLAILILKPKQLSLDDLERMMESVTFPNLADWLSSYVVKQHPQKEERREQWMNSANETTARLGWSLTVERIVKSPQGLDLPGLLDRLEAEMGSAPAMVQWTMNFCLGEIGIHNPDLRERAIAIGEKIGAYRDYPVSKGCTSPYVPTWVAEMVKRQG